MEIKVTVTRQADRVDKRFSTEYKAGNGKIVQVELARITKAREPYQTHGLFHVVSEIYGHEKILGVGDSDKLIKFLAKELVNIHKEVIPDKEVRIESIK